MQHRLETRVGKTFVLVGMREVIEHDAHAAGFERRQHRGHLRAFEREMHMPAEIRHTPQQQPVILAAEIRQFLAT